MPALGRRDFLAGMSVAALAAVTAAAASSKVRLGGPIFLKSDDPVELAKEHRRLGYSAAYVPTGIKAGESAKVAAARKAFAAQDVVIAEVGAWVNMLDPDPSKRKTNMQYVTDRLALADEIGALCCVDIAGSFGELWDGPDSRNMTEPFLEATVANCREVIDSVKPTRTKFSIEMMPWALPNTPDAYVKLIKAVDRPAFGAHVDVCNIVDSPERYFTNTQVIDDVFQKLAPWIISCHAKDVGPRSTHLAETIPGRGGIDYKAYLKGIAGLGRETPLMLEHLKTAEEYDEGRAYIQKIAAASGVVFA